MKASVGPIFSLHYELWITANRLFLPCLTYCGHRFWWLLLLGFPTLVLIIYIALLITVLSSHYCITEAGASVAYGGGGGQGPCPTDPPWGLNPHRPTSLLHNGWRTGIGRKRRNGSGALFTLWFIFNEVNRSFQVTCELTHTPMAGGVSSLSAALLLPALTSSMTAGAP